MEKFAAGVHGRDRPMKKRKLPMMLRPGGILSWSTACLIAGSLAGCDNSKTHIATEQDAKMANTQTQIEKLDAEKARLMNGEVANNFFIPRVGYYHAAARQFFEHPYGYKEGSRYFVNGQWQDTAVKESSLTSRPLPEALKKVETALEQEQKELAANPKTGEAQPRSSGFGMGNALMMYWLLSGNRSSFSPGAGFRQASGQAATWQSDVETQRSAVRSYSSANLGYQRLVDQSQATGKPVRQGQPVRGGFGSRASRGSSIGG
jgi:hypothetical protein